MIIINCLSEHFIKFMSLCLSKKRNKKCFSLECEEVARRAVQVMRISFVEIWSFLAWTSVVKQSFLLIPSLNYALTIRGSRECLSLEHFADATFFVLLLTLTLFMVSRFRNNIEGSVL